MDKRIRKVKGHSGTVFLMTSQKVIFINHNGSILTILYDLIIHLPIVSIYKHIIKVAEGYALIGCVTEKSNQNLTFWANYY